MQGPKPSINTNPFELNPSARRLRRSNIRASAAEKMEGDTLESITLPGKLVNAGILEYIRLAPLEHVTINIIQVFGVEENQYLLIRFTPPEGDIDMGESQVTLLLEKQHFTRLTITTGVTHMVDAFKNAVQSAATPYPMQTVEQGAGRETTPVAIAPIAATAATAAIETTQVEQMKDRIFSRK